MDNLQSMTYEMFEKDPVKYAQYEKVRRSRLIGQLFTFNVTQSIYLALCDRPVGCHT